MDKGVFSKNRRSFLKKTAGLSILTAINSLRIHQGFHTANAAPLSDNPTSFFKCLPYLQDPTPSSIIIRWVNAIPGISKVEYGETPALGHEAYQVIHGETHPFIKNIAIELNQLKPHTTYYYRACLTPIEGQRSSKEGLEAGALHTFTTPALHPAKLSLLVLNDWSEKPQAISAIPKSILHSTDLVFFNGRMLPDSAANEDFIPSFLAPLAASFSGKVPFIMGRETKPILYPSSKTIPSYFSNPQDRYYTSMATGPIFLIRLDSGSSFPDTEGKSFFDIYRENQALWLEREIQKPEFKKAAFRIVMMPQSPFYTGNHHGAQHCRKLFAPLFDQYNIDLCIHGSEGNYQIHSPQKGQHHYPIVIGGKTKSQKLTMIKLQADCQKLHLQILDIEGKEVDQFQWDKKA